MNCRAPVVKYEYDHGRVPQASTLPVESHDGPTRRERVSKFEVRHNLLDVLLMPSDDHAGRSKSFAQVFRAARLTSWDEAVTKLGYEHLKRHGLRHTGLTWMADAGVPLHSLRKIAGHGSLMTTQRYLHPDRQSVADAGELLSQHLSSKVGLNLRVV
jgi:integrase